MRKVFKLFLATLAILVFAAGCGGQDGSNQDNFAVVVDQIGREVVIPSAPERVISLSPSHTEVAFAIGLGNSIVGVSNYCNYPEEALAIDKIGDFSSPNMEMIVGLEPDLVLAGNMHEETVRKLEELGIPVLVLVPESLEGVFGAMALMAEATGKSQEAEAVISNIKDRINIIESKVGSIPEEDRVRVYYEVYSNPLMSAGGDSLINEVIFLAGGKNIFGDVAESYPKVSEEVLLERDPQFILFPEEHGTEGFDAEKIVARPLWDQITAVKENNVYGVASDAVSRHGPRLVEAAENLAAIFYPQAFDVDNKMMDD